MGWEAIEKYLTQVEKEIGDIFDQQVPEMLSDDPDCLSANQSPMPRSGDFYNEHMPGLPVSMPVVVADPHDGSPDMDEGTEYLNLDQDSLGTSSTTSQDLSIYDKDFYSCSPVKDSAGDFNFTEIQKSVKREHMNDCLANIHGHDNQIQSRDSLDDHVLCYGNQMFGYEEQEQIYQTMTSKIFSECIQDVQYTCNILRISPDPLAWGIDHVQQWIAWQCRQFNVSLPNMDYFQMTGEELSSLTEEQFKMYASDAGSVLSSRLDIWRSVVEQTTRSLYADYISRPPISQIPVPTSPSLPRSPDNSSPSPSDDGLPDQRSSAYIYSQGQTKTNDTMYLPEEPVNSHRQTIQLWQFLKLLLVDPSGNFKDCIRWIDRSRGIFKIENSARVAKLWGKRKNRPAMNYDKLSRSIRQYYKKGIIKKTEQSKRLVYQFCQP